MTLQLMPDRDDRDDQKEDRNQDQNHGNDEYDASGSEVQVETTSGFRLKRIILLLSLPLLVTAAYLSVQALTDPLSSIFRNEPEQNLAQAKINLNPPQTLAEIKSELAASQLTLGDKLLTKANELIYPVLFIDSKEIREIRIYQSIYATGQEKFRLVRKLAVNGLEEYFVKSPSLKFNDTIRNYEPRGKRIPLTELQLISGSAPSQGIWFMATGQDDNTTYGQIFCFLDKPEPSLNVLADWVSPTRKYPTWQNPISDTQPQPSNDNNNAIKLLPNEPQLVVDRSQTFEPNFDIYKLDVVANPTNPLQLRRINLNEALNMPRLYSDALLLASSGLWSPALAVLDKLKSDLKSQNQAFSGFVQEQYDFISYHAKITAEQAQRQSSDSGEQALMLIVDGRWQEALKIAQGSEFTAKSVADMLQLQSPHIWMRVQAALKTQASPAVKMWGALVVLQQQGLPGAQAWLQSQGVNTKEAIALLQRLDLSPLGIQPDRLLGTVTPIVQSSPGAKWLLPPSSLLSGQAWYEVDISVVRDGITNSWKNAPFPQLLGRSPVFVWQALGLDRNSTLVVSVTKANGQNETLTLTAQSFWVGDNGQLRILVTGDPNLSNTFKQSVVAPMVTGGNGVFVGATGNLVVLQSLDIKIQEKIAQTIYLELQSLGRVSLKPAEFIQQLSGWTFQSIDITGDNKPDLVLQIDRSKIDVGDRNYPMVIAFSHDGRLLFSDIPANANRRWVDILPSGSSGQILAEINGRYEILSLR